jgi:hypothetical protein
MSESSNTMRALGASLLALALAACAADPMPACRVDADCASGTCAANGTCATIDGGTTAPDAGTESPDAGSIPDAGTETFDAGPSGVCAPNHDGRIDRAEVPLRAGLYATFRVGTGAAVDTAGTGTPDAYQWDLTGHFANDGDERVTLEPLAGKWFAADFAGATYVSKLAAGSDLLGIFEVADDALLLRGVASPTGDGAFTKLTYDPPVKVLAFPLQKGASFTTTASVSGTASGIPFLFPYSEVYESTVDRQGTLLTPFGTFPVLRVRTTLTRTVGFLVTTIRTFSFASECFGTVAVMRSKDNETSAEFTTAAEVRRLAP